MFERADFERLAEQLAAIAGGFILSINDTPGAREMFGRFEVVPVDTTYQISGKAQRAGELIVRGGSLENRGMVRGIAA